MGKKSKKAFESFDINEVKPLDHLTAVPKSRTSSITSIESEGSISKILEPASKRTFDDLTEFEAYIYTQTMSGDYDYTHAVLNYYPPFILKECQNNLEKIKPTNNKNSKKFKRNLQHHIQKHLIKDLEKCCGYELNFDKGEIIETSNKLIWKFKDESDHGFSKEEEDLYDRHWKLELEVSCTNESAMVDVEYKSIPIL
ncbi:RGI1 [Candida pseudojiufengensis]|uniref:RGI1 n=1 Tax=Candida pseudojiufengensis TaxID=497109 RepID=UPI0022251D7C|nr:RGI1 [Candida pseudojiufengensis]KAI5965172.1 RGI1 [Candida pseudojiufengensis]